MKKVFSLLLAALLLIASASAATYVDADTRVRYYYQYEGAPKDSAGTWDKLLADKLYALYGHNSIYMDSSTSKYLTGRGCCLFSFSHAWQFLLGKSSGQTAQAAILYGYLKQNPKWSNTGSTTSPPNAASYYASYLGKQSGITSYSVSNLKTYSSLSSFFNGGRGCIIVNAPGHYILAVGCTTYNGTQYVQIVDSVLSGTIRTGRCTLAKSMDFSTTYTPANAETYTPKVHQYWLPYSQFSTQCKLSYAYKSSASPGEIKLKAEKSSLLLARGGSAAINVTGTSEALTYSSSNTSICTVSSSGLVTAKAAGEAQIVCSVKSNPYYSTVVTVMVFEVPDTETILAEIGKPIEFNPVLPAGATAGLDSAYVDEPGVTDISAHIYDKYGDVVKTVTLTVICPDFGTTLSIPATVTHIYGEAFSQTGMEYIILPESVEYIGERAFADSGLKAVIVLNGDCAISSAAFDGCGAAIYVRSSSN